MPHLNKNYREQCEDTYNHLKKELNKNIIIIDSKDNVEKNEIRSYSVQQVLELLINNKVNNETKWN